MLICYIIFSVSLCLWEICSGAPLHVYSYGVFTLCLVIAGILGWLFFRNNRLLRLTVLIMLIFINLGGAVAAGVQIDAHEADTFNGYLGDFKLMLVTFPVVYLLIRWLSTLLRNDNRAQLRLHSKNIHGENGRRRAENIESAKKRGIIWQNAINVAIAVFSIVALVETRLMEREVNGSHLYFLGVFMVFGIVIFCYPFVAGFAFSKPERFFLFKRVNTLSLNMLLFLGYTVALFFASAACNEFGLILVLLVTATVLFFDRCKNTVAKFGYSIACIVFAVVACMKIDRIWTRVQIWLNPGYAVTDQELSKSTTMLSFLFQTFSKSGFWGQGIGSMPKTSAYQALNSDYVLTTLIHDYSLFIALAVIVLGVVMTWCLLQGTKECVAYDRYLNLSLALIIGTIILIHVGSNLGSFITSGIGFPWISDGGMNNVILTALVAVHCALVQRQEYGFHTGKFGDLIQRMRA